MNVVIENSIREQIKAGLLRNEMEVENRK